MADFPETLFAQIYGRAATDADRQRLLAVKANLRLSDQDEFWPIIMVLDHYTQANERGRKATVVQINKALETISELPAKVVPLAEAQAKKAIAESVEKAAAQIAKVSVTRSEERADRISKRQLITARIGGGILAAAFIAVGAAAAWFYLDVSGICAEPPGLARTGETVCIVDRNER